MHDLGGRRTPLLDVNVITRCNGQNVLYHDTLSLLQPRELVPGHLPTHAALLVAIMLPISPLLCPV